MSQTVCKFLARVNKVSKLASHRLLNPIFCHQSGTRLDKESRQVRQPGVDRRFASKFNRNRPPGTRWYNSVSTTRQRTLSPNLLSSVLATGRARKRQESRTKVGNLPGRYCTNTAGVAAARGTALGRLTYPLAGPGGLREAVRRRERQLPSARQHLPDEHYCCVLPSSSVCCGQDELQSQCRCCPPFYFWGSVLKN